MKIINSLNMSFTYFIYPYEAGNTSGSGFIASGYMRPGEVNLYRYTTPADLEGKIPIYAVALQVVNPTDPPIVDGNPDWTVLVPINATYELSAKITTPLFG